MALGLVGPSNCPVARSDQVKSQGILEENKNGLRKLFKKPRIFFGHFLLGYWDPGPFPIGVRFDLDLFIPPEATQVL